MARTSSVDYEHVAKACSSLFLEGKNTSFDGVYDLIGRKGSAKVVQGLIADWRKEMAERFVAGRSNPDLPQELVDASDRLLAGVWQLALSKSDEAYAGERQQLTEAEAAMDDKVAVAQNRAAEFEREALTLQEKVRGLEVLIREREAALVSRQQETLEIATLLRAKNEEIAGVREDMGRLLATLAAERLAHATALQLERQRHDEAIERERQIALGERQHLLVQTDQIRQAAHLTESALREQLNESRTLAEAFREKAGRGESAIEYQRGRAEAAEEATKKAAEAVTALQQDVASLRSRADAAQQAPAGRSGTPTHEEIP